MDFFNFKPQIIDEEYGPEPSIREFLFRYYISHDTDAFTSQQLTEQYIEKILEQYQVINKDDIFIGSFEEYDDEVERWIDSGCSWD